MTSSVWNPAAFEVAQVNAAGVMKEESFSATAGQTVFTLTTYAYAVGTGSLLVFKNGALGVRGVDWIETDTFTFTLLAGANVNDVIVAVGFVGVVGSSTTDAVLRADLYAAGGANNVRFLSSALGATIGPIATYFYTLDAVAQFGCDNTYTHDYTSRLATFFLAFTDNCIAVMQPGNYQYTPAMALSTGAGYLNMNNLTNCHLFGYGATVKNLAAVTTAPSTDGQPYGFKIDTCTDCSIRGVKFDGHRDTTFGTNGDGNEFYAGFFIRGSTRCGVIDVKGVNCQGDGFQSNRLTGNTGFNNDCYVKGSCYFGGNRRNEMSIGGDYGMFIGNGVTLFGSSDAHRTNPQAGMDLEWEHATIGPTGNNTRTIVDGVSLSGTMAGGGIYIPNTSGVLIDNVFTSGIVTSISIDNTRTGSYETQNINIGAGCSFHSTYGIVINGGANITGSGFEIQASYPVTVNSSLSAAPYQWVMEFDGLQLIGESVYAFKITAGRSRLLNWTAINCASGGGVGANTYMGLAIPTCEIIGCMFQRDGNQTAPDYGLILVSNSTVCENTSIRSQNAITHPVSYGHNSVPAYPAMRTNYYNGALLADLMSTSDYLSGPVDCSAATPILVYVPRTEEIVDVSYMVETAGTNVVSTTKLNLGTIGTPLKYLNQVTISAWGVDGVETNLTSSLVTVNMTSSSGVFAVPTPGNNNPKIRFHFITRLNRASLYTSTVLFS